MKQFISWGVIDISKSNRLHIQRCMHYKAQLIVIFLGKEADPGLVYVLDDFFVKRD
jgi:hypothetical protein